MGLFPPNVPIKEIHAGDEEEVGKYPGYGISPADTQPAYGGNQPDADTGTGYHLHHSGKNGEVAVAQSLNAVAQNGKHAQAGEEITGELQVDDAVGNNLRFIAIDKQQGELVGKEMQNNDREDHINEHDRGGGA